MDDGVRERHGVKASSSGHVDIRETDDWITVHVWDGEAAHYERSATVSPARARYLARQLNRLARRIEKRNEDATAK